jgi:hypothetical protein
VKLTTFTLVTALVCSVSAHAARDGWSTYTNETVGYSITYPSNLTLAPWKGAPESPSQWRTKSFTSKDGEVELYIETFWTRSRELKDFFNEEFTNRARGKDRINYSVIKENWYVISGTNSKGYEFYKKFFVFSDQNGTWYICFDFVYPHSQHKIYDPVVAEIARKFVPNLPGNHDH